MQGLIYGIGGRALFTLYWCIVSWFIGYFTGWRAMARRFPATVVPLSVDNRTLELLFREDVRPVVSEHLAHKKDSLSGPFSNELFSKR